MRGQLNMNDFLDSGKLSLEGYQSETEVVRYGRLKDQNAEWFRGPSVFQRQYEVKASSDDTYVQIRVRESIHSEGVGTPSYELTIKLSRDGSDTKDEYSYPIDREAFERFAKSAESGMAKRRYTVPVWVNQNEQLTLEIDLFTSPENVLTGWVKVDIEYDPKRFSQPPVLNFLGSVSFDSDAESLIMRPLDAGGVILPPLSLSD